MSTSSDQNESGRAGSPKISTSQAPCQPASRSTRISSGVRETPSPGSARSPRSPANQSATCTPVIRSTLSARCRSTSGVSQMWQRSTMIPTPGSPASSRSSSASGIVVISVSVSRSEAWIGSSPRRTPASSAAAATRCSPSMTIRRASAGSRSRAGPVKQRTQAGSKAAKRSTDAQSDAIRVSTSSGPSITVLGRIEGTSGTQFVTRRPLARTASRFASSLAPSFISQIPIPSKPAAAYARRSSRKLAATVEISESERLTPPCGRGG